MPTIKEKALVQYVERLYGKTAVDGLGSDWDAHEVSAYLNQYLHGCTDKGSSGETRQSSPLSFADLTSVVGNGIYFRKRRNCIVGITKCICSIQQSEDTDSFRRAVDELVQELSLFDGGLSETYDATLIGSLEKTILVDSRVYSALANVYRLFLCLNRLASLKGMLYSNLQAASALCEENCRGVDRKVFQKVLSSDSEAFNRLLPVVKTAQSLTKNNYLFCFLFSFASSEEEISELAALVESGECKLFFDDETCSTLRNSPSKAVQIVKESAFFRTTLVLFKENPAILTELQVLTLAQLTSLECKEIIGPCRGIFEQLSVLPNPTWERLFYDVRRFSPCEFLVVEAADFLMSRPLHVTRDNLFFYALLFCFASEKLDAVFVRRILQQWNAAMPSSPDRVCYINPIYSLLKMNIVTLSIARQMVASGACTPFLALESGKTFLEYFYGCLEETRNNQLAKIEEGYLVSVIVTVLNPRLDLLELALRSISLQTYRKIEVILIDDCSKESLSKEIEDLLRQVFQGEITYTYLRNERNVGQYVSRNIALTLAKGDFWGIQDDDDISHPQRFEKQMKVFEQEPHLRACFTRHIRFDVSMNVSIDEREGFSIAGDAPPTLLCRKDVLNTIGNFKDFRSRGDVEFRERLYMAYGRDAVRFLNIPLYYMRASKNTVSSVYEYFHGDKLSLYRDMISTPTGALETEQFDG